VQSALAIFKMFHWYVWLAILGTHAVAFGGMLLFDIFHNGHTVSKIELHYMELYRKFSTVRIGTNQPITLELYKFYCRQKNSSARRVEGQTDSIGRPVGCSERVRLVKCTDGLARVACTHSPP
jgi:hypothetical protein